MVISRRVRRDIGVFVCTGSYHVLKTQGRRLRSIQGQSTRPDTSGGSLPLRKHTDSYGCCEACDLPIHRFHVCRVTLHVRILITLRRALPAFTIHTAVRKAKTAFQNVKNPRIRTWGPTATGLAIVPFLPYLFDHAVEEATDRTFDWIEEKIIEANKKEV